MSNESETEAVTQEIVEPQLSAGQLIKQARTQAGLHIAALAVTLKVPVKRLEALEEDNMALLPDIVFVRALAASVCRTLNVHPDPILAKLPKAGSPRLDGTVKSIDTPVRSALSNDRVHPVDFIKTPWVIGGAILMLGAAAIFLWPKMMPTTVKSSQEISEVSVPVTSNGTSTMNVTSFGSNSTISTETVQPASLVESPSAAASIPPDSIVVFKATGDTWIEVKDAKGISIFKQLMKAGESAGVIGDLPLSVTVGSTNYTQVLVRGELKDLAAIAKNNVAFFEVK